MWSDEQKQQHKTRTARSKILENTITGSLRNHVKPKSSKPRELFVLAKLLALHRQQQQRSLDVVEDPTLADGHT